MDKIEKPHSAKTLTITQPPNAQLEQFSVIECKTYFDAFAQIVKEASAFESFADMPDELCEKLMKDTKALKLRLGVV